jgi:NTPase
MPDPAGITVIVTGAIQAGKSTVARAVMAQLGWVAPAGFFTHWGGVERPAPEIFIEPWTGGAQVMAHQLPARTGPDGLPYALEVNSFSNTARASLPQDGRPVVVDELGVLELGSDEFSSAFAEVVRGPSPVLVVIQERALDRWRNRLGLEASFPLVKVTPENRRSLPAQIVRLFRS